MFPKKMGALKGCRGHMEGLKGPYRKDIEITAKTI